MKNFLRDVVEQTWTATGFFVAWCVLDGSAKTVTGYAIIGTSVFWMVTFRFRNPKDEE